MDLGHTLLVGGLISAVLSSRFESNVPFYACMTAAISGIFMTIAKAVTPICSDGSLVGEALIRACG